MMFKRIPVFALTAFTLSGCMSTNVSMYPVEGPFSQTTPLPVITATADGIEGNSGDMTLTLPNGESCAGKWSSVAPQVTTVASGSLLSIYGPTLGFGTSTSNVGGTNKGQAFLSCSGGTTIDAEFVTGSGTADGYGVAKDSGGNVYKMIF